FETARVEEMLQQFISLLEEIVAAPDNPIRSYPLVTERSRTVLPDPTGHLDEPKFSSVGTEFLRRAKEFPGNVAVTQTGRSWTYDQLSTAAVNVAHALLSRGVTNSNVVAITGPRSFGLIASMVGTFMSGGIMLTLDRHLPANRQRLMLTEARTKYLLYVGPW